MTQSNNKGAAYYSGCSWFHRYKIMDSVDGTVKYSRKGGFETKELAEASYKKYEAEFIKASRNFQLSQKVNTEIGLKDYLLYWFEEVFSLRIENSTRMICAYTLYDLILPNLQQDIKLRFANTEYFDALLAVVSKACSSAGNKAREFLYLSLKEAVAEGFIKNNPMQGTKTYPRKKPTVVVLNKANIKKLLSAAYDSTWYLEILLALFMGLRKGEISGVKFSDVDYTTNSIYIQRQITSNPVIPKGCSKVEEYSVVEKEPKTDNSYRKLKMPEVIVEEIKKRKVIVEANKQKYGDKYYDHDYISCQDNGAPHSTSAMNMALTKLCARNGITHVTVHGLRHMFSTILIEQGVSLVKISALLGHKSVTTTYELYCDMMDENEQIISFMNNIFAPEESEESC